MNPPPPQSLFQSYLLPGERVVWTGRPKQGLVIRAADTFLIPFSLLWAGFVVIWNIGVRNAPLDFRLFGLIFLIVGIYFTVGRFLHDAVLRRRLAYAVTDQRVLMMSGSRSSRLQSLGLHHLPMLEMTEHSDGTGTITFDQDSNPFSIFGFTKYSGVDWWVPSLSAGRAFFRIDNPRHVYQLIQRQTARA